MHNNNSNNEYYLKFLTIPANDNNETPITSVSTTYNNINTACPSNQNIIQSTHQFISPLPQDEIQQTQQQQPIIATSVNYNFNHNLAIRHNSAKKLTAKTNISFNHNNKSFKEQNKVKHKETITTNSSKNNTKPIQIHNKKLQKVQETLSSYPPEHKQTIQYQQTINQNNKKGFKSSVDDYLNRRHLQEIERLKKMQKEKEKKEKEVYCFAPKISEKSKRIVNNLIKKEERLSLLNQSSQHSVNQNNETKNTNFSHLLDNDFSYSIYNQEQNQQLQGNSNNNVSFNNNSIFQNELNTSNVYNNPNHNQIQNSNSNKNNSKQIQQTKAKRNVANYKDMSNKKNGVVNQSEFKNNLNQQSCNDNNNTDFINDNNGMHYRQFDYGEQNELISKVSNYLNNGEKISNINFKLDSNSRDYVIDRIKALQQMSNGKSFN